MGDKEGKRITRKDFLVIAGLTAAAVASGCRPKKGGGPPPPGGGNGDENFFSPETGGELPDMGEFAWGMAENRACSILSTLPKTSLSNDTDAAANLTSLAGRIGLPAFIATTLEHTIPPEIKSVCPEAFIAHSEGVKVNMSIIGEPDRVNGGTNNILLLRIPGSDGNTSIFIRTAQIGTPEATQMTHHFEHWKKVWNKIGLPDQQLRLTEFIIGNQKYLGLVTPNVGQRSFESLCKTDPKQAATLLETFMKEQIIPLAREGAQQADPNGKNIRVIEQIDGSKTLGAIDIGRKNPILATPEMNVQITTRDFLARACKRGVNIDPSVFGIDSYQPYAKVLVRAGDTRYAVIVPDSFDRLPIGTKIATIVNLEDQVARMLTEKPRSGQLYPLKYLDQEIKIVVPPDFVGTSERYAANYTQLAKLESSLLQAFDAFIILAVTSEITDILPGNLPTVSAEYSRELNSPSEMLGGDQLKIHACLKELYDTAQTIKTDSARNACRMDSLVQKNSDGLPWLNLTNNDILDLAQDSVSGEDTAKKLERLAKKAIVPIPVRLRMGSQTPMLESPIVTDANLQVLSTETDDGAKEMILSANTENGRLPLLAWRQNPDGTQRCEMLGTGSFSPDINNNSVVVTVKYQDGNGFLIPQEEYSGQLGSIGYEPDSNGNLILIMEYKKP